MKATSIIAACLIAVVIAVPVVFHSVASRASQTDTLTEQEVAPVVTPSTKTTAAAQTTTSTVLTTATSAATSSETFTSSTNTSSTTAVPTTTTSSSSTLAVETTDEGEVTTCPSSAGLNAQEIADYLANELPTSYGTPASPDRPWRILTHTSAYYGGNQVVEEDTLRNYLELVTNPNGWEVILISHLKRCTPDIFEFTLPEDTSSYSQWCEASPAGLYENSMLQFDNAELDEHIQIAVAEDNLIIRVDSAEAYLKLPSNRGYVVTERVEDGEITGYSVDYALYEVAVALSRMSFIAS